MVVVRGAPGSRGSHSLRIRRGITGAVLCAGVVLSLGESNLANPRAPSEFDADPKHPIVVGEIESEVVRRAERLELLVSIPPQPTVEDDRRETTALLALVRRTFPNSAASASAGFATAPAGLLVGGTNPQSGGFVTVGLRAEDDRILRTEIGTLVEAIDRRDPRDPIAGARVASLGRGFHSCDPFVAQAFAEADTRVRRLVQTLGTPLQRAPILQPIEDREIQIDGPPRDAPLCGPDQHERDSTSLDLPSVASYAASSSFRFAEHARFDIPRTIAYEQVPDLWAETGAGARIRVRAAGPVLALEGRDPAPPPILGFTYTLTGPNGRYDSREDANRLLDGVLARLRALGIRDDDCITQRLPNGRLFVQVRTRSSAIDEAVIRAIGGDRPADRDAVVAMPTDDGCSDASASVARSVADAAAHASRVAASLGTTADTRPIAIRILGRLSACGPRERGVAQWFPSLRISGRLPPPTNDAYGERGVYAAFRIGKPNLMGRIEAYPVSDRADRDAARFRSEALDIDYPQAEVSGVATYERRLAPQTVAIDIDVSPDNAHDFAPIHAGLAETLTASLHASESEYVAAIAPAQYPTPTGDLPDGLTYAADVPYRGAATADDARAALRAVLANGYGGLDIVPERRDCASAADALAHDAILAAARSVRPPHAARIIAIDLDGPSAVSGSCRADSGRGTFAIRSVTIPDVEIAAYARVSYGR